MAGWLESSGCEEGGKGGLSRPSPLCSLAGMQSVDRQVAGMCHLLVLPSTPPPHLPLPAQLRHQDVQQPAAVGRAAAGGAGPGCLQRRPVREGAALARGAACCGVGCGAVGGFEGLAHQWLLALLHVRGLLCVHSPPNHSSVPVTRRRCPQAVEQKRKADDIAAVLYPNDATE